MMHYGAFPFNKRIYKKFLMDTSLLTILNDGLCSGVFPWAPKRFPASEEIYQIIENGLSDLVRNINSIGYNLNDKQASEILTTIQDVREAITIMKADQVQFIFNETDDKLITGSIPKKAKKLLKSAADSAKLIFNQKINFTQLSRLVALEIQTFCSIFLNQDEPKQCISVLTLQLKLLKENFFPLISSPETPNLKNISNGAEKDTIAAVVQLFQKIRLLACLLIQMWSENWSNLSETLFDISDRNVKNSFGVDGLVFSGMLQNRVVLLVKGLQLNGTQQSVIVTGTGQSPAQYVNLKRLSCANVIQSGQSFGSPIRSKNIGNHIKTDRGVIVYTNGDHLIVNWGKNIKQKTYQLPREWKHNSETATLTEIDGFVEVDKPGSKKINLLRARDGNNESSLILDLEVETVVGAEYWCLRFSHEDYVVHLLRAFELKLPKNHLTVWSETLECFEIIAITNENPHELVWSVVDAKLENGVVKETIVVTKETVKIVPDFFQFVGRIQVQDMIVYDKIIILAVSFVD